MFASATIEKRIVCRTVGDLRKALECHKDHTPICGDLDPAIELTIQRNNQDRTEYCIGFSETDE